MNPDANIYVVRCVFRDPKEGMKTYIPASDHIEDRLYEVEKDTEGYEDRAKARLVVEGCRSSIGRLVMG
jgi:hypothetical protein